MTESIQFYAHFVEGKIVEINTDLFPREVIFDSLVIEEILNGDSQFAEIHGRRLTIHCLRTFATYALEELPDRPAWKGTRVSHNA